MPPADGSAPYERALDKVRPVAKLDKPEKPTLSPFQLAAQNARDEVLRAIRECGTTNTDILHGKIGTHTLRPKAYLGDSIIADRPLPPTQPLLEENTLPAQRQQEREKMRQWLENFPESLKF